MVREHVWWATGCSGAEWIPMDTLGGMEDGTASVSTLVGRSGVCTEDSGETGWICRWAITLGAAGGFSLGVGWVWCGGGGRRCCKCG